VTQVRTQNLRIVCEINLSGLQLHKKKHKKMKLKMLASADSLFTECGPQTALLE